MADFNEITPDLTPVSQTKKKLSDDMVDGFAVLALILIIVSAAIYWLASLPDAY